MTSAFFLPAEPGDRFCVYHRPAGGAARRGIVYVHPFCEEMNKARRMAALQSRRLAAEGYAVLQIDLFGCGDSSGDLGDARWGIWKQDLHTAAGWLKSRVDGPLGLWGMRLGALLAADASRDPGMGIEQLLLWQPVSNGEQFLTQFLWLRLANEMISGGAAQTGVRELRKMLAGGMSVDIVGYDLHPQLAAEIEGLRLADLVPAVKRVHCLEVATQAEPKLSPATERTLEAWRAKGVDVRAAAVKGEPFWSMIEIVECEALLAATDGSLKEAS